MKLLFPERVSQTNEWYETEFDRLYKYYNQVQQNLGCQTVWSIFEVENINAQAVEGAGLRLYYDGGWGEEGTIDLPVNPTFADLWTAADILVRRSGDGHHLFIEAFKVKDDNTLYFVTGS